MPEKKNGAVRVLGRVLWYALIAVMAAAIAVYICGVMSYDAAIEVFVDGESVGCVSSMSAVRGRVRLLESELSEAAGERYSLAGRGARRGGRQGLRGRVYAVCGRPYGRRVL